MSGRRIYLNIRHKITALLNPALCLSCGIPIEPAHFFCKHCFDNFEQVQNACSLCGLPNKSSGDICAPCLFNPPRWQQMIAPLAYKGQVRDLIHDFKFNEQIYLANAFVRHLACCYRNHPVDVLIPVPLHKSRYIERGFNQSEEIARLLCRQLNIALDTRSLQRIKATEFQYGLSIKKRQKNLLKAFIYNPARQYRSVALIDDIITSGSTMSEISKLMKRAGVEHVEVWSLARALKQD